MGYVVSAIFGVIALLACAFVAWPAWRAVSGGHYARLALAGAAVVFVLAIGLGTYLSLGRPDFAKRALTRTQDRDYAGMVAELAQGIRKRPNDVRGWLFLGAGYMKLRHADLAAKAFARAIETAGPLPPGGLYALYGEELTVAAEGEVTPEAQTAFEKAVQIEPGNYSARYYLGLLAAEKHENDKALALWNALLADAPKDAPWRGQVLDRIAMLSAEKGQAPDIAGMVAMLAGRLQKEPHDPEGWQRLIRAYAVLGQKDKALGALATARKALSNDPHGLADLESEARTLKLD